MLASCLLTTLQYIVKQLAMVYACFGLNIQSQRGTNETGLLLYLYPKENLDPSVKHVVITQN